MTGTDMHPHLRAFQQQALQQQSAGNGDLQFRFQRLALKAYPESEGPLEAVVKMYLHYGNTFGFFWAEALLMRFLPDHKPDGKCCDIEGEDQLARFYLAMHDAIEKGERAA